MYCDQTKQIQEEITLSYKHFTLEEREYLHELLNKGYSFRKIAGILGRNVSSISREVNRNKSKHPTNKNQTNKYLYHPWKANTDAIVRRRKIKKSRLTPEMKEYKYIVDKLNMFWSPEEICMRWREDNPDMPIFGIATIYRYIKSGKFGKITPKTHLRRRGKRINIKNSNFNTIQPDRTILEWSEIIRNRERIGDWEGDTIYGGIGKGLLITEVDRKTRYLRAALIPNRDAVVTADAMIKMMQNLPVKSISLDNGSEFSEFRKIEKELDTVIYFAEPHKPWQRGTNENTNDILRFFFPKGFDFRTITQDDVDYVVSLINSRPRKCLNWRSPAEVLSDFCVALT